MELSCKLGSVKKMVEKGIVICVYIVHIAQCGDCQWKFVRCAVIAVHLWCDVVLVLKRAKRGGAGGLSVGASLQCGQLV